MKVQQEISGIGKIILQYLKEKGDGLDAEALWLELRKQGHQMCVCSVYLNLKKLAKLNRLKKTQTADRKYVYALNITETD
ncbi:transcriptional repressor [Pedobacter sp. PLR]|uniref:transcriptional repressor n=1 Tax=Pedobacter sp. PLR TaxID=2994465 RepID=UPI0022485B37|nr:transcriptional repressor [Pedobacter sp. PLR]MCX2453021.1 transcriptional repressor [Pedobacter sp. PLR]